MIWQYLWNIFTAAE